MAPLPLRHCRIFLVSPAGPTSAVLRRMLAAAGLFQAVPAAPTADLPALFAPGRVNIVLAFVAGGIDGEGLAWVRRIRHHREPNVALAPLVAAGAGIRGTDLTVLARAGFDDVLALPAEPADLAERLHRTIAAPAVFYRTRDYFGPDRRAGGGTAAPERRGGTPAGPVSRLTVRRSPETGCAIVEEVRLSPVEIG